MHVDRARPDFKKSRSKPFPACSDVVREAGVELRTNQVIQFYPIPKTLAIQGFPAFVSVISCWLKPTSNEPIRLKIRLTF